MDRFVLFFTPPKFDDLETSYRANILSIVLNYVALGVILFVGSSVFLSPSPINRMGLAFFALFVVLGMRTVLWQGAVQIASLILVGLVWLILMGLSLFSGGVVALSYALLTFVIVVATLLLGQRAGLIVALLSGLGGFIYLIVGNPTPFLGETAVITWMGLCLLFFASASLAHAAHQRFPKVDVVSAELESEETKKSEKSQKQAAKQLKRDADRLVMLNEIGRTVSTQQDLPSVLESIYQQARQRLQIDSFYVSLYYPETNEISYPILYDEGKKFKKETIPAYDEHFVVKIVNSGKPIWITRTEEELVVAPGEKEMLGNESRKSASLMYIPLVTPEAIIGVISAQSYTLNAYNEDDLALLSGIGYHVAVAVQNARLVTVLRHELEERKRAEAEVLRTQVDLHVRETHLRTILDNMPLLIWLKDNNGRYLAVNQAMVSYGGYDDSHRLIGKTDLEIIASEQKNQQQLNNLAVIVGEQPDSSEELVYHKDTSQWFETYKAPILDDNNVVLGTFGFARDITDRKRSEARFRSVFEDSAIGMVLVRSDHSLAKVNQAFCQMLGYTEDELHDRYFKEITHPEDVQQSLDHHAVLFAGEESSYQFEKRYLHKQGHEIWAMLNVSAVKTTSDLPQYAIAQVQDIMEQKKAEADRENLIRELELRNTELERFAYTVSHDLKTPLITIGGFLGYLEIDARNGDLDELDGDIANIRRAVSKMRLLLDELLELSRIGRLMNEPELVPFEEIVRDALALAHGRLVDKHIQVTVQPELPSVLVDKERLIEVVQNLVENAAKYMGDQTEPHIWIGMDETVNQRIFTVRDNGMGIAPAYHEQIFGLFNKLSPEGEGTGIGLALVKRIVEVHNGRLWVESDGLGQGSTFCFTLNETEK